MRSFPAFVLAVSGTMLSGCWSEGSDGTGGSANCYGFNCTNLLTIHVVRRDAEAFIPGEYTFSIDDAAVITRCVVGADNSLDCSGDTDTLSATITPENDEFTLRLNGAPVKLAIDVLLDGDLIGTEELTPTYQIIVSDDPGCEASCLQGSQIIGVQSPKER